MVVATLDPFQYGQSVVTAVVIKTLLVVAVATQEPFQYVQSVGTAGLTLALVWIYFCQVGPSSLQWVGCG